MVDGIRPGTQDIMDDGIRPGTQDIIGRGDQTWYTGVMTRGSGPGTPIPGCRGAPVHHPWLQEHFTWRLRTGTGYLGSVITGDYVSLALNETLIHLLTMTDSILGRIKGMLLSPVQTFHEVRTESDFSVYKYFLTIVVINSIFSSLVFIGWLFSHPLFGIIKYNPSADFVGVLATIIILVIAGFFLSLVWALWLHIFVYALGGRKGVMQTIKAQLYGFTPFMLLGWIMIPFGIGVIVGGIWSFVITAIGIREVQEITTGRATIALVTAIVVAAVILLLVFGAVLIQATSSLFFQLGPSLP